MRRLHLFILLITSAILLVIPKQLANACSFRVAPGEYRFWLLQPDLTREKELTPFFFASTYLYKGSEYFGKDVYSQKNIEEWLEHIRKENTKKNAGWNSVSRADIDSLLNSTPPDYFFTHIGSLISGNSFLKWLMRKENAVDCDYLRLSKKVEQIAANPDPWGEGVIPQESIAKIIEEAKQLYRNASSDFIRIRTSYQLMRLYGFSGNASALCRVYDDRIEPVATKTWIKSAALYLKATQGELPEGDHLLAQVFDRGDYKKSYCLRYLHETKIDYLITTAHTAHQRVVLQAMKAFNYPGRTLDLLQKIYAAEPGYRELPFLLLREINKTEDWLITGQVTGFKPAVYDATYYWQYSDSWDQYSKANLLADRIYASRLNEFLLLIIKNRQTPQPALLHLFSSHLSMLLGDYKAAGERLQAAGSFADLTREVRTQIAINCFLLKLETRKGLDAPLESRLLQLLQKPADRLGIYDADIMKEQLILYTARKMIRWGDKGRGLMLLSRTRRALGELPISTYKDVYEEIAETATPPDYDKMIAILGKQRKSSFERFVTNGRFSSPKEYYDWYDTSMDKLTWNVNRLLDGKASWYLRNNNLEAAARTLRRIPDSFWRHDPYKTFIGGNPFYLDIYKTGHYSSRARGYSNKRLIVDKMIALNAQSQNGDDRRDEDHFQLANAWYNMSYWGNNWLMVKPWWSMYELNGNDTVEKSVLNDFYYGCNRARELYLLAMKETHDKKLAALCCYMAGVCDDHQKEYHSLAGHQTHHDKTDRTALGTPSIGLKNPYLDDLRKKGFDDRYYREIVKECAVYIDYIRKFDRAL